LLRFHGNCVHEQATLLRYTSIASRVLYVQYVTEYKLNAARIDPLQENLPRVMNTQ